MNTETTPKDASADNASLITSAELRQRWKVSGMFLLRMRQAGKLRALKLGAGAVRFSIAEIQRIEQEAAA